MPVTLFAVLTCGVRWRSLWPTDAPIDLVKRMWLCQHGQATTHPFSTSGLRLSKQVTLAE